MSTAKTYELGEPVQAPHKSVVSVTMVGRDYECNI